MIIELYWTMMNFKWIEYRIDFGFWTLEYFVTSSHLSGVERYFCFSNLFSRPMSCSSVNTVLLRRPFLLLLSPSVPGSSLALRCRSSGRWWDAEPRDETPERNAELSGDPREQDTGNFNRFCSAFSTDEPKKEPEFSTRNIRSSFGFGNVVMKRRKDSTHKNQQMIYLLNFIIQVYLCTYNYNIIPPCISILHRIINILNLYIFISYFAASTKIHVIISKVQDYSDPDDYQIKVLIALFKLIIIITLFIIIIKLY